ncbi:MAG: MoaD/ThiS family protein [Gammaproteobacteria bacterium]|nr:MoaD/ThiS family protein [Gammaproteobacteria bacterium]
MARVVLTGNLRSLSGGDGELELEARNVRELLARLAERYPKMAPHLEEGLAVAIDGEIHQDDLFAPIGAESEVHLMPKIAGG